MKFFIDTAVRHPMHIVESAMLGAHDATIPFKIIQQHVKHPLPDRGMEGFLSD